MSKAETIITILTPDRDGTVHLPVPSGLRRGKVKVRATLEPADGKVSVPVATSAMVRRRKKAFQKLRKLGGLSSVISDPVAWQRQLRKDRALPGRH